jgi:hypothetical protein
VISSEVAVTNKKEKDLNSSSKFLPLLNIFMSEKKLEFIIPNKLSVIIVVVLAPMIQMMLNNVLLVVVKVSSSRDIKLDPDSSNKFKLIVTDATEKERFSHLLATSVKDLKFLLDLISLHYTLKRVLDMALN